jgi:hypothetical protein
VKDAKPSPDQSQEEQTGSATSIFYSCSTRTVVVMQISGNQDHVALEVFGKIEDLFKGGRGVEACFY